MTNGNCYNNLNCPFKCITCSSTTHVCTICRGDRITSPSCVCPKGKFDNGVDDLC